MVTGSNGSAARGDANFRNGGGGVYTVRSNGKYFTDMSSTLLVILIAVVLVAFFVVGMSLTLIFKGHNIKSEISDNEHMKERGIKCAVQETLELDGKKSEEDCLGCSAGNCGSCDSIMTK